MSGRSPTRGQNNCVYFDDIAGQVIVKINFVFGKIFRWYFHLSNLKNRHLNQQITVQIFKTIRLYPDVWVLKKQTVTYYNISYRFGPTYPLPNGGGGRSCASFCVPLILANLIAWSVAALHQRSAF
jgi:hypothetical protein